MLVPHVLKTTCHTHVHCDNYISACQANLSKVTILNFLRRKIRMAFETSNMKNVHIIPLHSEVSYIITLHVQCTYHKH